MSHGGKDIATTDDTDDTDGKRGFVLSVLSVVDSVRVLSYVCPSVATLEADGEPYDGTKRKESGAGSSSAGD
jgi:hypothetical protein